MPVCPHCKTELVEGAYACALCGYALPARPWRRPRVWPLVLGACAGAMLGCVAGLRWGGYAAMVAAPMVGFAGMMLGMLVGSLVALAAHRGGGA